MDILRYHILNAVSVCLFSYALAATINGFVRHVISPDGHKYIHSSSNRNTRIAYKDFMHYNDIIESGFFKISDVAEVGSGPPGNTADSVDDLNLVGTITGPASIARALIQKQGEKYPKLFALYRVNNEIGNNVYGYKLVGITDSKVYLILNGEKKVLDLYEKKSSGSSNIPRSASGNNQVIKKTLSRAEIKQKVFNNLDNALKGLVAGPYRVNGQIQGYALKQVRPYNILYKFGARSGDIVKRINGKKLTSTQGLYQMWEEIKTDSQITIDIQRHNRILTYDFKISD